MKVKMVAESLNESVYARLNEEMNAVSEGVMDNFFKAVAKVFASLNKQYEGLNKEDEKAVRAFAQDVALKTYVADAPTAGQKALQHWADKAPIEMLKEYLEKAAQSKFSGRTTPTYIDKKLKVSWKDMSLVKLKSEFLSGGTDGHTSSGGV
jgi:hypothetical protein